MKYNFWTSGYLLTCTKRLISVCSVEYNGIIGRVSNFGLMTYVVLRLIIEGNKDKRIRCRHVIFAEEVFSKSLISRSKQGQKGLSFQKCEPFLRHFRTLCSSISLESKSLWFNFQG